mgnify:FL=1
MTVDYIADQPEFEVVHFIERDLDSDGNIENREGYMNVFYRRILLEDNNGNALVWDSGLQNFTENNRIAIAKEARENGDFDNIVWDILYSSSDVGTWKPRNSEIPVAGDWLEAWSSFEEGTLIEQTHEDGNVFSDEAQAERQEKNQQLVEEREQKEKDEETERLRLLSLHKSIYERTILEQEISTLSSPTGDSSTISYQLDISLVEIKSGTGAYPKTTYSIEQVNDKGNTIWQKTASSLDVAQKLYSDRLDEINKNFEDTILEEREGVIANTPKLIAYDKTEFIWEVSPYTFQEMLTSTSPDYSIQPLWRRALYLGPYSDASSFIDGGNTLSLNDYDTPRVTAEGITANPSGAVAFTIRPNWRVTFELETDSELKFISDTVVDGIESVGGKFTFTMYAGDRLEIDIDNERNDVGPFLISVKGKEWFSATEPDDEIKLTLIKAERLFVKYDVGKAWILPDGTEVSNMERVGVIQYETKAWNSEASMSHHYDKLNANPEYAELKPAERERFSPKVNAEESFVAPEDLTEDISTALGPNFKWWVIGGITLFVGVVLVAVYVKSRAESSVANKVSNLGSD